MKYFGFIKEHNESKNATSIKDLVVDGNLENPHRKEVIEYLNKGKMCVPFMGCVEDANDPAFDTDDYDDDDFVAYMAVYTDGKWVWPHYIVNYLEKYPHIKIDKNFVDHVLKNKKKEIDISESDIKSLEKKYLKDNGFDRKE